MEITDMPNTSEQPPAIQPKPPSRWGALVTTAFTMSMVPAMALMLLFVPIPTENKDAVMLILGAALGWATASVQYWQGSSAGSASKDARLAALQPAKVDDAPAAR